MKPELKECIASLVEGALRNGPDQIPALSEMNRDAMVDMVASLVADKLARENAGIDKTEVYEEAQDIAGKILDAQATRELPKGDIVPPVPEKMSSMAQSLAQALAADTPAKEMVLVNSTGMTRQQTILHCSRELWKFALSISK